MIANVLTIAVTAPNVGALRAAPSGGFQPLDVAICVFAVGTSLLRWAPASMAIDDGSASPNAVRPNDISPASPGRWLFADWPEHESQGFYGEILVPIDLNTAALRFALQVGNGWTLVAVTETATTRRAWFKRTVLVNEA